MFFSTICSWLVVVWVCSHRSDGCPLYYSYWPCKSVITKCSIRVDIQHFHWTLLFVLEQGWVQRGKWSHQPNCGLLMNVWCLIRCRLSHLIFLLLLLDLNITRTQTYTLPSPCSPPPRPFPNTQKQKNSNISLSKTEYTQHRSIEITALSILSNRVFTVK